MYHPKPVEKNECFLNLLYKCENDMSFLFSKANIIAIIIVQIEKKDRCYSEVTLTQFESYCLQLWLSAQEVNY